MINRVRQLRKERLMSLDVLAERTGVTKSYLSKVERGQSTPSIAVTAAIARALGVPLDTVFVDADGLGTGVTVTRAAERRALTPADEAGSRYEGIALEAAGKQMTPFMLHPAHEPDRSPFRDHPGEEFLFVHTGRAALLFPSGAVELEPGDSVYFDATTPHKVRTLSPGPRASVLLLISAPGPSSHPHLP
ncbi:helix-turn-helix domain-containing protein [Streptomyces sp. NPDC059247]|uniref:helix-turn-helix domain-containing protein n=1 Tax=Streptomyces sp. NPDC059247 TaxID=3346790 RepID=UPI0036876F65